MAETVQHGIAQSGTTANRPANAPMGFCYYDTTLNKPIWYDETNGIWRYSDGTDAS